MPPHRSQLMRAKAANFWGLSRATLELFLAKIFGTVGQRLQSQKGSNFQNVYHFDRKEQSSGFSVLARSLL